MTRAVARAVCGHFAEALRDHGVPDEVLTDNGKVFTGRFSLRPVEVLFDRICRENGITHRLTAPASPTTTGKIERFHRTLRVEFLAGRVFDDLPTAQAELDAWVADYNTDRPHQAIGMATPAERFTARPDVPDGGDDPTLSRPGSHPHHPPRHHERQHRRDRSNFQRRKALRRAHRHRRRRSQRVLRIYFDGTLVRSQPRTNNKPVV